MEHRGVVRRSITVILGLGLVFGAMVPVAFSASFGGAPGLVFVIQAVMLVARLLATGVHLAARLAPVDRWAHTSPAHRTDAMVRDAAVALQHVPRRHALFDSVVYASSGLVTAIVLVSVLHDPSVSSRYFLPALGGSLSLLLGSAVIALPLAVALTADARAAVIGEAVTRGIDLPRERSSVGRRIAVLALGVALAPLPGMAGMGLRAVNDDARDVALLEARLRASEAARVAQGPEEARSDVAIVPFDDPHPCVARAKGAAAGERAFTFLDVPAETAHACTRLDDGRFVVAKVPVEVGRTTAFLGASGAFLVIVAFWAPLVAFVFGRWMALPIARIAAATKRIAEVGDLGAMGAIPVSEDDELGELTRTFNALVTDLRGLAEGASAVAAGDLTVKVSGRGDLADAFRGMLERLRDLVRPLRETSMQIASAATEIYSASQEQEAAASQQAEGMREVTTTMESLSGSAAHIAEAVKKVLSDAERNRQNTDQTAARIADLNGHAARIGELLEVIRDVADRSDLLALNGSLEATHAGEAGKGFTIVASEMRRLAERVTATVDSVRTLLTDIRASGSAAVMATDESRKVAASTEETARRITLVVQQQRSATDAVGATVKDRASVVAQSAIAATQTRVSTEDLKVQADRLEALLRRFVLEAHA
ncbi:MAG: methyl-accepting chemotaxis protein [Myxococcales bacterium]|nr:methyl-accepting chemotaxis protein [Myxococcales bacterium]